MHSTRENNNYYRNKKIERNIEKENGEGTSVVNCVQWDMDNSRTGNR